MKQQILERLQANHIRVFYHFTDINNLPYIASEGGLLSIALLRERDLLDKIITGGNPLSQSLDEYHGHTDKVHLNLCPKVPMLYLLEPRSHLCYLRVTLDVAVQEGVLFTDINAATTNHHAEPGLKGLTLIDFTAVNNPYAYRDPEQRAKKQAEVLIPDMIPHQSISEIVFRSQASLDEGKRLWPAHIRRPKFILDPSLFNLHGSFVSDAFLTSERVSENTVRSVERTHRFNRSTHQAVTLVVSVYANAGETENVVWSTREPQTMQDHFPNRANYWSWSRVSLKAFNSGEQSVEYSLATVRQFTLRFRVR